MPRQETLTKTRQETFTNTLLLNAELTQQGNKMSTHRAIASLLLVLILTFSAFFVVFPYDSKDGTVLGQVGSSVGGTLLDNTVWTPSGSPYNFVSDVVVAQNSTLTNSTRYRCESWRSQPS